MNKADRATHLLMDDFFAEELQKIKQDCIDLIVNSKPDDYEVREDSYKKIRFVDEIKAHFESIAADKQIIQKRWKIL